MAAPAMSSIQLEWWPFWMQKLQEKGVAATSADAFTVMEGSHCFKPCSLCTKTVTVERAQHVTVTPLAIIANITKNDQLPFHVTATPAQLRLHKKCNVLDNASMWGNFVSADIFMPF